MLNKIHLELKRPSFRLSNINIFNFNIAYVVNPKTNLKINLGLTLRDLKSEEAEMQTQFINFGIQSDLFNHYYDF